MPPKKEPGKPKGPITSYAAFVQVCREEHKKKHPDDQIVFAEFSKKCAERWRGMDDKEKKRFEDISCKDKARHQREMAQYTPPEGVVAVKRKAKKDPNAPKRALSAFFFFCGEFRSEIKTKNPDYGIGDIAKELGRRWEKVGDKTKYNKMAEDDKKRYAKAMAAYNGTGKSSAKKSKPQAAAVSSEESEEESD